MNPDFEICRCGTFNFKITPVFFPVLVDTATINSGVFLWVKFMNNEETIIYECSNIGIAGTTPVHIKRLDDGTFEARCGFALMGATNMSEDEFAACDYNPFHDNFNDNYSIGYGVDEVSALEALKADMKRTADSLWL